MGLPTLKTILANRFAPGLLDRYLAKVGYSGQVTNVPVPNGASSNLRDTVPGPFAARGRFDAEARDSSWEFFTSRHRDAVLCGVAAIAGLVIAYLGPRRARSAPLR